MNHSRTAIRVACVEDDPNFRSLLKKLFVAERGFELLGVFQSAEQAISPLLDARPDVVLLDVGLPGWTGIDCLCVLGSNLPQTAFVMLTGNAEAQNVFSSLKAGASGYLLKTTSPEQLMDNVRAASAGGGPLSPEVARMVVSSFHEKPATSKVRIDGITPRETEMMTLLAQGMSAKEAAHEMGISYETVRDYLKTIYQKLKVRSRTEAVLKFVRMQQQAALRSLNLLGLFFWPAMTCVTFAASALCC